MATHKAIVRIIAEIEFDDDGSSNLESQASDALDMSMIDPRDCDYFIVEVVENEH